MADPRLTPRPVEHVRSTCGSVTVLALPDRCVVRFTGDIDADMSAASCQQLIRAVRLTDAPVHVDCSAVTFFGAHGLGMLSALRQVAPGGQLTAFSASPALHLVFSVFPAATFVGPTAA